MSRLRRGVSKTTLLAALGGLVLCSVSVLVLWMMINSPPNPTEQLDIAFRLMRKGDIEAASRIANTVDKDVLKKKDDISKREFLLGANERVAAQAIQQRRIATETNERAVDHLQKSRKLMFPQGYEGLGNYYLGMALFDLFRWTEAKHPLEIASERWPQGRNDAIEHLIDIDLASDAPNPEEALKRIDHWKGLPPISPYDADRIAVKEMETLYSQGEYDAAIAIEGRIPKDSPYRPAADLVLGRCYVRKADKDKYAPRDELLAQALACFNRVQGSPRTTVSGRRQSILEEGRTMRKAGKVRQAVSTLSALRLSSPYEPESLAGGIEEIDALIDLKNHADAVATLKHLTTNFGETRWYQNDWFPIPKMREQLIASANRLIDDGAYSAAADFATFLPPFCVELDRLRITADAHEKWAASIRERLSKLENRAAYTSDPEYAEIEKHHFTAAKAYAALARKQMRLPEYDELLWKSIENYRNAMKFTESNDQLALYLQFQANKNQDRGLLMQARNFKDLNNTESAMKSLERLIENNAASPLAYDARLEAARIHAARKEYDKAEELIVENLYFGELKPESPLWKDSLLELGLLLLEHGEGLHSIAKDKLKGNPSKIQEYLPMVEQSFDQLTKGIARLEEGLERFKSDPRRFELIYRTAKAYKLAAFWPDLLLQKNLVLNEESVARWKAQKKELTQQSRNMFAALRKEITEAPNATEIDPHAENLLCNSYFGEADLLYDTGDYQAALVAYRDAANRFINEPESLEALTQIARCQQQLGQFAEMRRTLEIAKDVLARMVEQKNERFALATRHDRKRWEDLINWMLSTIPVATN